MKRKSKPYGKKKKKKRTEDILHADEGACVFFFFEYSVQELCECFRCTLYACTDLDLTLLHEEGHKTYTHTQREREEKRVRMRS